MIFTHCVILCSRINNFYRLTWVRFCLRLTSCDSDSSHIEDSSDMGLDIMRSAGLCPELDSGSFGVFSCKIGVELENELLLCVGLLVKFWCSKPNILGGGPPNPWVRRSICGLLGVVQIETKSWLKYLLALGTQQKIQTSFNRVEKTFSLNYHFRLKFNFSSVGFKIVNNRNYWHEWQRWKRLFDAC